MLVRIGEPTSQVISKPTSSEDGGMVNQYKDMKGFYKVFEYKVWDYTNTFRMKGWIIEL